MLRAGSNTSRWSKTAELTCYKGEAGASSLKAGTVSQDKVLVSSFWVSEGDVEYECVCNEDEEDDCGVFFVGKI